MASRKSSGKNTNCPASNSSPTEKSKNAVAVRECRERKKEKEKEREKKREHLKDENQRLRTNISAMEAEMSALQNIFETHNEASGGRFSQDAELKQYFK